VDCSGGRGEGLSLKELSLADGGGGGGLSAV